jgi:hypothetical protein
MLFILSRFYEIAEEPDNWPPSTQVEPKVAKVRAIGGKAEQYAFYIEQILRNC